MEEINASANGFFSGDDINEPTGQHPRRPARDAVGTALKDSHAPPHKVLLNPLFSNAVYT
jgi:hypothetical protein